jgi:hypothetical protein
MVGNDFIDDETGRPSLGSLVADLLFCVETHA